jgi:hypothetical protein
MAMNHFGPKLHKKRVLSHVDWTIYSVNGFSVRNVAQPDEEFGNFATRDEFPNLIPQGEIWISEKTVAREGVFFIANALTRCKRNSEGATNQAYDDGLSAEMMLREKLNGIQFRHGKPHVQVPETIYEELYREIGDIDGAVRVWIVNGNLVRSYYKTDYTEGGHGYVYPWVPRHEIWIDDAVDRREMPFIVCHEFLERRLMRDERIEYDRAHEICSRAEFELRKCRGAAPFLAKKRRRLHKNDLGRLANDELFQFILRAYAGKHER